MKYPKITIVTPSYNQGKYLELTILSILNQNYPNLEYIIMDGGSSDNSVDVIKKYDKHITYWQSQLDGGQSAAINAGFAKGTGDIYCWLNSDDQFTENTLNYVGEFFVKNLDVDVLCGRALILDSKLNEKGVKEVPGVSLDEMLKWSKYLPQSSCFFRSEAFNKFGPLDESLNMQMDYDLWLKFAAAGLKFKKVDRILSKLIVHPEAKTSNPRTKRERIIESLIVRLKYLNTSEAKKTLLRNMPPLSIIDVLKTRFKKWLKI